MKETRRKAPQRLRARQYHESFLVGLCWSAALLAAVGSTTTTALAFSTNDLLSPAPARFSSSALKATEASSPDISSSTSSTTASKSDNDSQTRKVALLLCPAQFCVPQDYQELWEHLPEQIEVEDDESSSITIDRDLSRVVPLSRRDWIKVSKQLPTTDFWNANLSVHKTLDWYFEAIEEGLSQILYQSNSNEDVDICLVGHSIGGWVARAYLGGLSRSSTSLASLAQDKITSLITLGTPHASPTSALVDQTRGLLQEIADAPSCSSQTLMQDRGIDVTCVCSSSLPGNFATTNVEEFVAASSYLPLLGRAGGDVLGDGIVPLDLAFMESPARRVVVEACPETGKPVRHSHVLPTPWNLLDGYAPSIRLDDTDAVSYVSPDIVPQWAKYIR